MMIVQLTEQEVMDLALEILSEVLPSPELLKLARTIIEVHDVVHAADHSGNRTLCEAPVVKLTNQNSLVTCIRCMERKLQCSTKVSM